MTTTASVEAAAPTFRSVLRRPDLRWLAAGLTLSTVGAFAYHVALYTLVYETTSSPAWAAATTLGRFVPSLLFSSYGGVLAERFERRRVLMFTDAVSMVVMLALVAVAGLDLPLVLAIVLASLISMLGTLYMPASAALLPDIVDEHELATANALLQLLENVVVIAGPALGALAVGLVGIEAGFVLCAVTFSVSVWCSWRMTVRSRPTDVTEGGEAGVVAQVAAGFRALGQERTAATLVLAAVGAAFFYGVDTVLFVVLAEEWLGIGADGYGWLTAGLGIGGILVAPFIGRLAERPRLATIIAGALLLYTLPTAVLVAVDQPVLAVGLQVLRGVGAVVVDVLAVTALQRSLPSEMTARVMGVFVTLILSAISLGALVTPLLLRGIGLQGTLLAVGGLGIGLVVLTYPRTRALDEAAASRLQELEPLIVRLSGLGIFADATRPALERLAAAAVVERHPAGTALVSEGEPADALYVLQAGRVEVSARGELGAEHPIRVMEAGSYFGELGLLAKGPRTATVRALEDVEVARIPGDEFLAALSQTRPTAAFMEGARMRLARTHPSQELARDLPVGD